MSCVRVSRRLASLAGGASVGAVAALLSAGAVSAAASRPAAVDAGSGSTSIITFTYSEPGGDLIDVGFTGGLTGITQQAGAGSNLALFAAYSNGFSVHANGGNVNAGSDIIVGQTTSGTPITGSAMLPSGATLTVSINGGSSATIKNGAFSIPNGASVGGTQQVTPTVGVSPKSVRTGGKVTISGVAPAGSKKGAKLTLLSDAFPRGRQVAGFPAITTTVNTSGRYSVVVQIPASVKPNTYGVTGLVGHHYLPVAALKIRG
jgi:hypothetical protein